MTPEPARIRKERLAKRVNNPKEESDLGILSEAILNSKIEGPRAANFHFHIEFSGELSAGLRPYSDDVLVIVNSGDPGGEPGEFLEFLRTSLREWFDGAAVMTQDEYADLVEAQNKVLGEES